MATEMLKRTCRKLETNVYEMCIGPSSKPDGQWWVLIRKQPNDWFGKVIVDEDRPEIPALCWNVKGSWNQAKIVFEKRVFAAWNRWYNQYLQEKT